jgi:hypothetical protein
MLCALTYLLRRSCRLKGKGSLSSSQKMGTWMMRIRMAAAQAAAGSGGGTMLLQAAATREWVRGCSEVMQLQRQHRGCSRG